MPLCWLSAYSICFERANFYDAISAPLLILDDLGAEVKTPTAKSALNDLILARYSGKLPTIITSNLSLDDLNQQYGARMYERIIQYGKAVDCGHENLRLSQ